MSTTIALTLMFAAVTSGLGISRQVHGYRHFKTWPFLAGAVFATGMMLWFAFAASWVYRHG